RILRSPSDGSRAVRLRRRRQRDRGDRRDQPRLRRKRAGRAHPRGGALRFRSSPHRAAGADLMISAPRLEAGLAAQRVELGGALRVDPVPSRYSTSYALHDLTVLREDGPPLALVVKDLEWASMLPEARRTKPRFLYDPSRE